MNAERLLSRLKKVKARGPGSWAACCPAHEDSSPSLTVTEERDRILVHCHAGCTVESILAATGLDYGALFSGELPARSPMHMRELGEPAIVYDYLDAEGLVVFQVARYETPSGKQLRPWLRDRGQLVSRAAPAPRVLYRLPEVLADRAKPVLVVEGEKCADAAAQLLGETYAVTTWAGGAEAMSKTDFGPLIGRFVVLWPDCDEAGRKAMAWVAKKLGNGVTTVKTINPGDRPAGWDVADAIEQGWGVDELTSFLTPVVYIEVAARKPRLLPMLQREADVMQLWAAGLPAGEQTGWESLKELYTVVPGQVTVITGWPGSGKSEWLDALLVNLAHHGWRFVMHSPENFPVELHIAKLMEKWSGKPFGAGVNERIPRASLHELMKQLDEHFALMDTADGILSVPEIIESATAYLGKSGKRGLVIDPWNEVEHLRPQGVSETEYISMTLSMVRNWARVNGVHVWIVAHPQKVQRDQHGQLPVPRPDLISGSQHWWNKPDNCITVWRDQSPAALLPNDVRIIVCKIRFKHVGRVGEAVLNYDRVTGQYFEKDDGHEQRGVQFPT